MNNKNNTPEQKAQWQANKKIGSRFMRVIPSSLYNPDTAAKRSNKLEYYAIKLQNRIRDLKRLGKQVLPIL